jgi:hypothetical protein
MTSENVRPISRSRFKRNVGGKAHQRVGKSIGEKERLLWRASSGRSAGSSGSSEVNSSRATRSISLF